MKQLSGFALGIGVEILFAPIGKKIATQSPPERPNPIFIIIKFEVRLEVKINPIPFNYSEGLTLILGVKSFHGMNSPSILQAELFHALFLYSLWRNVFYQKKLENLFKLI